jgi:Tfp pilus assembly protein PilV
VCRGRERDEARDEGFGLVEAVVAMALLAIVVSIVGAGMLYTLRATTAARERSVAVGLIGTEESVLQATPYSTLSTGAWPATSTTSISGVTYTTTTSESTVTSGTEAGLLDFSIEVSWPNPAGGGVLDVSSPLQIAPT